MSERADIDTGEPIEALASLREEPVPGLLERVRAGIERRTLTSQVTNLVFQAGLAVILEFLELVFQLLQGRESEPENPGESE